MNKEQKILRSPFDIITHKDNFVNYLEVVVLDNGIIEYAVPSHQEKLINIAKNQLGTTRDKLFDLCPIEYYFDVMTWLCAITGAVALWNEFMIGHPNIKQRESIQQLIDAELYKGVLSNE